MRRSVLWIALLALVATSCARGAEAGTETRTILADFRHDEFASIFLKFFPRVVTVRPGDTLQFKQTWTGEPHTVTMGTTVDTAMATVVPFIEMQEKGEPLPEEEPPEVREAFKPLPYFFGEDPNLPNQTVAQPCYLDSGTPPTDGKPCSKRKQPVFKGTQAYYNSGYIHYSGARGNKFSVKLSKDLQPGIYNYYCAVHGPLMSGQVVVKPEGSKIPSQDEVNKKARTEIEKIAAPVLKAFREAKAGKAKIRETPLTGNLAGYGTEEQFEVGISEFIPRTIKAKVGEKVTWKIVGDHTISFDVPKYFPIVSVKRDGTVQYNPKLHDPAGGSPPIPEEQQSDSDSPPKPLVIDGGTWGGSGFFSSGLIFGEPYAEYSLRFSKPGKYKFACLVHPPMVGTIEIR